MRVSLGLLSSTPEHTERVFGQAKRSDSADMSRALPARHCARVSGRASGDVSQKLKGANKCAHRGRNPSYFPSFSGTTGRDHLNARPRLKHPPVRTRTHARLFRCVHVSAGLSLSLFSRISFLCNSPCTSIIAFPPLLFL